MASLLGQKIKDLQSDAMKKHVPLIIQHYLDQAHEMCGEVGQSVADFKCYICAEDSRNLSPGEVDLWESLCIVTDAFSKETLARQVGIVIEYEGADTAIITWSGE